MAEGPSAFSAASTLESLLPAGPRAVRYSWTSRTVELCAAPGGRVAAVAVDAPQQSTKSPGSKEKAMARLAARPQSGGNQLERRICVEPPFAYVRTLVSAVNLGHAARLVER